MSAPPPLWSTTARAVVAHAGSQARLADLTGIAQSTISRWTRRGMTAEDLEDLVRLYHIATGHRVL